MNSHPLHSIDLDLVRQLQTDAEYRERFFLAEASAEIARQLIRLRKLRGYSQAELAERAGTQQPAVSRAEQADYKNWSFNALRKLTNAMKGRLRVIIEPLEEIIDEYRDDPSPESLSSSEPSLADEQAQAIFPEQRGASAALLAPGDDQLVKMLFGGQVRLQNEGPFNRGQPHSLSGSRHKGSRATVPS